MSWYDCRYLVDGTTRHQVVLCNNLTNLRAQRAESDEMTKGRIPLGLFAIIDGSSSRHLRLRRAGVARTRGAARREAADPTPKPRSETMSTSSTQAWKRKEESRVTRFSKQMEEQKGARGDTADGVGPSQVSEGVSGDPATEVEDGSGPDDSGDDADLPEEVESDGDDGATDGPEVVEEDMYDESGMKVAEPVAQIVPESRFIYDVRESQVPSWHTWVPGVVPDMPRFDLQAMNPWALSFADEIEFAFKVRGRKQHALLVYDVVTGGYRCKQETSKKEHGTKMNEIIVEEALHRRPYQVTVASDGCGSMRLLRDAALSRGVNHFFIPPWSPEDNPVEGVVNHFKSDVATVLLSACAVGGALDESFVGYAAEYVCWMHERFAHSRRGDHRAPSPWHHNFKTGARMHRAVPFGTAGRAHVSPALRAKRGSPKYERTEPVICLGYQHVYSDVYRCLTRHGTIIHSKQVVWDVDAPLGVWLDDRHELDGGKITESELYGSAGLQLFKEKAGAKTHRVSDFGGPDAVLRAVATRMLRRDGTPRPADHIFQRCQQNDGICVQEALRTKFLDRDGLWRQYTEADLRYDLARGYLAIDVHSAAREGEGKKPGPKRAGAGKKDKGSRARRRACSAVASEGEASSIALRDLKWGEWLHGQHHDAIVASYHKEFNGLTSTVLEELAPDHADYATAVRRATNCRVILEYKRSGVFKTRCVIQGFREAFALLDGADFKYASDVAGLAAVRNLVFDPIDPGEDIQISSIDIAQAYLQSDFFPETDPPRFLKVKDPITGDMRYYRQHGVLYGAKSSGVRWQNTLHPFLVSLGFIQGRNEPCAFFHPEKKIALLSYVDDLLLRSSLANSEWFYERLKERFDCKDVQWLEKGKPLDHLGMTIFKDDTGVYISMQDYIRTMLVKLGMKGCASPGIKTPIKKAIDDLTPVNMQEKAFFMSACGMLGWLAMTARPDLKYSHSRISQHMSEPTAGALEAVRHAVRYCATWDKLCLHQPYGARKVRAHYSDSDHAGNAEPQNKRRSQLASVSFYGDVPTDWSSTATSVQISEVIDNYEAQVAKAAQVGAGSPEWQALPRYARIGNPTCHPSVSALHADVSSAAAEIYAASVALSRLLYMSYACDEMGQAFDMPIEIGVDNATAITFASGTVKKSKLRHIDARQDWVQALRDSELVKLVKVPTKDNYADLMTKILEPETFTNLRDGMMVSAAIPESVLERSGPSGYNKQAAGRGAGAEVLGAACAPGKASSVEPGAAPRRQKEIGGLPGPSPG